MFTETLEAYLGANYDEPQGRQVLVDAGNFFLQFPDPAEIDGSLTTRRIKIITKMASHALNNEMQLMLGVQYAPEIFESAVRYCKAGVERITSQRFRGEKDVILPLDLTKMHGHFYTHISEFERALAGMTENPDAKRRLLEASIRNAAEGIGICERDDSEHAAYQLNFKALAERSLADICMGEEKRKMLLQSANSTLESARRTEHFNARHAAFQYTFTGDHFYEIAGITEDSAQKRTLLEDAVSIAQRGAEMLRAENPVHWAMTTGNIGKFAHALYDLTGDLAWKHRAMELYKRAADHFDNEPGKPRVNVCTKLRAKIADLKGQAYVAVEGEKPRRKKGRGTSRMHREIQDGLCELDD